MAAAHVMRPQALAFPAPTAHSPASVSSPTDASSRAMYGQQYPPNSFYSGYSMPSGAPFMPQSSPMHNPYTAQPLMQTHYRTSHTVPPPPSPLSARSFVAQSPQDSKFRPLQSPGHYVSPVQPGASGRPFNSASTGSSAPTINSRPHHSTNPGPIPATQPIVMQRKQDGVNTIKFEYSKERVKVMHEIQCNVESVVLDELTDDFKDLNCVYPRAHAKEDYKGNRWQYETECNKLGWALAALNPQLQGKRGLIQRAVDSVRNCAPDPKLRSRRVRRLQKTSKRQKMQSQGGLGLRVTSIPATMPPSRDGFAGAAYHQGGDDAQSMNQHQLSTAETSRGSTSGMFLR